LGIKKEPQPAKVEVQKKEGIKMNKKEFENRNNAPSYF